ncbi:hypothetical protein BK138_26800 [Paenibacillus rhizosphaerae]|uniref:Copper amine oxidase-like N-terminal domain-containing protein n=1 Tax=Paenibacillus rhizosphaerae TaxID=297318 RepID=A0A1R1EFL4_9BACL|nr:copper amine oxidase N-terminal domain-containing protein [Paenibacillus rhizosphaerae]OMF50608.1 hypothetical protein BK138_26800 [Paenibacillus rhizosphaerae]
MYEKDLEGEANSVLKKTLLLVLSAISLIFVTQVNQVSAASPVLPLPSSAHVYLKAGPFYILYTHPTAPYIDQNNRLLVPLRSLEELFGGSVSYLPESKTAQVEWLQHQFKFVVGSNLAEIDGKSYVMDTKPVMKNGAISLPIRLFLDETNLDYHWDNRLQVLVLDDERILVGEPFTDFKGNDLKSTNIDNVFQIKSYSIEKSKYDTFALKITANNQSGKDIPKGKADIHPLVSYGKMYGGFATDSYSRPAYPAIPGVKAGEDVTIQQNFPLRDVEYIITVARVFK